MYYNSINIINISKHYTRYLIAYPWILSTTGSINKAFGFKLHASHSEAALSVVVVSSDAGTGNCFCIKTTTILDFLPSKDNLFIEFNLKFIINL